MKKSKLLSTFDQLMISQRDLFRNELRFRPEKKLGMRYFSSINVVKYLIKTKL